MTGTDLVRFGSLDDKLTYARYLADSGLLPTAYRRQPANVLYATEYGEMLGLAPLAAINGLHIIEGTPTASAGMVSALVRRAGHRLRAGYDQRTKTGWCEIVRYDDPDFTYRAEWTIERAVDADLVAIKNGKPWARDKNGKPKPWERFPQAMLKARAITECARDACEEALNGVHYTPEELGADVDETGVPLRATAERTDQPTPERADDRPDWDAELAAADTLDKLRQLWDRAKEIDPHNTELADRIKAAGATLQPAETPEPDAASTDANVVDAEVVDAEVVSDPPAMANDKQLTAIAAALGEHGVTEREDRLAVVSLLIGEPVESTKQLQHAEASHVLDAIASLTERSQFADTIAAARESAAKHSSTNTPTTEDK